MALFSASTCWLTSYEIVIPNDTVNEARALKLLKTNGLLPFKNADDAPTIDETWTPLTPRRSPPSTQPRPWLAAGPLMAQSSTTISQGWYPARRRPGSGRPQDRPSAQVREPLLLLRRIHTARPTRRLLNPSTPSPSWMLFRKRPVGTAVEVNVSTDELRQS